MDEKRRAEAGLAAGAGGAGGTGRPDSGRRDETASRVWRLVTARLRGSGLAVRALAGGLAVSNPADRDAGRVHVAYADGYVCRERVVWDHWGYLAGVCGGPTATCDAEPTVTVERIVHELTES